LTTSSPLDPLSLKVSKTEDQILSHLPTPAREGNFFGAYNPSMFAKIETVFLLPNPQQRHLSFKTSNPFKTRLTSYFFFEIEILKDKKIPSEEGLKCFK